MMRVRPKAAECSHPLVWWRTFGGITRRLSRTPLLVSESQLRSNTAVASTLSLLNVSPDIQSSLRSKCSRRKEIQDRQNASA